MEKNNHYGRQSHHRRRRRSRWQRYQTGMLLTLFLLLSGVIVLAVAASGHYRRFIPAAQEEPEIVLEIRETAEASHEKRDPHYMEQINPEKPMVALTYDDGPYDKVTSVILDKLEQHGAHATFFMVGQRAEHYPKLLHRMAAQGCELANHTYSHTAMNKLSPEELKESLLHGNQVIRDNSGVSPVLMRPVGGSYSEEGLAAVGEIGMSAILWSVDTKDWKTRNADAIIESVRSQIQDGDIILMHDLYEETGAASQKIIDELAVLGYQMVTVSELASYRGGLEPGKIYRSFRP